MTSSILEENDSDYFDDENSGSETEDHESQTSDDDDEIDLENLKLNDNSTWQSLYNSKSAGLTEVTANISSIEDAFLSFIPEKMLEKILIYSNIEYSQSVTSTEKSKEIAMIELKAFIGLLLLAGLLGKSRTDLQCLWRRSSLESPIFKATISRSRFQKIIACLRFDYKKTREERKKTDKFAAIREVWSYFQDNMQKCYTPESDITIDEQLLGFRGKCPFRQYMPKKPDKYGLKLWLCVDVDSHYVFNASPYLGRQPMEKRQTQIGAKVVLELLKPLYGSSRNVTMDNFFTSVPLAKELQAKNLSLIGTLRKNKSEIPMEFLSNKNREVGSSLFGFQDGLTIVSFVPKYNKAVLLLSSKHHDSQVDNQTGKPIIILDYNKTKGAVDTIDQLCHKYTSARLHEEELFRPLVLLLSRQNSSWTASDIANFFEQSDNPPNLN
ncbi:unnamed protein product [Rotaria sp. Silwood1]|nr:unnamed protein product [Rotaria sp. Silwood1]